MGRGLESLKEGLERNERMGNRGEGKMCVRLRYYYAKGDLQSAGGWGRGQR